MIAVTVASPAAAAVRAPATLVPKVAPPKVALVTYGFFPNEYAVRVGVVLRNRSTTTDALDVRVTIRALDARGVILGTSTPHVTVIPAGQMFNLADTVDTASPQAVARLQVSAVARKASRAAYRLPTVSEVKIEDDGFGGRRVVGLATNPFAQPLGFLAKIHVVFRATDGRVIGTASSYFDDGVPARSTAQWSIPLSDDLPADLPVADVSVENEDSSGYFPIRG